MPAELQYIIDHGSNEEIERIAQLGVEVFGVKPDFLDMKATAQEGCRRFREWLRSIGMPVTLKELGVPEEAIPRLAALAPYNEEGKMNGYMTMTREDVLALLMSVK